MNFSETKTEQTKRISTSFFVEMKSEIFHFDIFCDVLIIFGNGLGKKPFIV